VTAAEILDHLERREVRVVPVGEARRVSGGLLNELWRVPARPEPVIVKHAPPHVASNPTIPLDAERIAFEARALDDLSPGGRLAALADDAARPPRPIDFDAAAAVLVMEDLGSCDDLVEAIARGGDAAALGAAAGRFVGRLHAATWDRAEFAEDYRNLAIQRSRLEVQYGAVSTWLEDAGVAADDAQSLGARARDLGERWLEPGRCLLMGDLWPPSILVVSEGVRIIDWEFAHFGSPVQDVAHLAAHLRMQAHHGAHAGIAEELRAAWTAFAEAYATHLTGHASWLANAALRRDLATHFAAELLTRSVGAFSKGFVYDGLPRGTGPRREIVEIAVDHLCDRLEAEWLGALG
jgi:5-methylthioribose kinase